MASLESPTPDQQAEFTGLINSLNDQLEAAAQTSANHAFNLGCSVSLLPLAALVIVVFFIAGLPGALIAAAVGLLAVMGLVALFASTARKNSLDQTYRLHVDPEIERNISPYDLSRADFDRLAAEVLPSGALLRRYLSVPEEEEDLNTKDTKDGTKDTKEIRN